MDITYIKEFSTGLEQFVADRSMILVQADWMDFLSEPR